MHRCPRGSAHLEHEMLDTLTLVLALASSPAAPSASANCSSYNRIDTVERRVRTESSVQLLHLIAQQAAFCAGMLQPPTDAKLLLISAIAYLKSAQPPDRPVSPEWQAHERQAARGLLTFLIHDKHADAPTRRRARELLCRISAVCGDDAT